MYPGPSSCFLATSSEFGASTLSATGAELFTPASMLDYAVDTVTVVVGSLSGKFLLAIGLEAGCAVASSYGLVQAYPM